MGWRTVIMNTHSKLTYTNNHLIFKTAEKDREDPSFGNRHFSVRKNRYHIDDDVGETLDG